MKRILSRKLTIAAVLSLLVTGFSSSICAGDTEEEGQHEKWGLGLFIGATEVHRKWEETLGAELKYFIDERWSVAVLYEQTDGEDDPILYMGLLGFRPHHKFGLQAGIGTHEVGEHSETTYRLAIDYIIHLGSSWHLEPYAAYDFIENSENEPVLGFYIGKLF
jgi:hypothetical protein